MKKLFFLIFVLSQTICFSSDLNTVLGEGDLVPNINWKDSDGGAPQMKHLYDITSQGKYVWIDFSSTQCSHCSQEAPVLEETWDQYGKDDGDLYVVTSMFYINENGYDAPGFSWDELNGSGWRTQFDPPLSFYLCSKDTGLYRYMYDVPQNPVNFGVEGFPRNILIGPDNIIKKITYGYSPQLHRQILAEINEGLGILYPSDFTAALYETEHITLSWSASLSSATYTPIYYNIYKNGEFLIQIDDISETEYIDEDIEEGMAYHYQITTTYERNATPDLVIESLESPSTEEIIVGDLGEGEWLYWGDDEQFTSNVGVSRVFAYAADFDLGETQYRVKAIKVANKNNGTVDWRIVDLADGLIKGTDPIYCGNELLGTLEGTINTIEDFQPVTQTVTDDTKISGHIAVVAFASAGNKSLAAANDENHDDWYSEEIQTDWNWQHLGADINYYYQWYLKIFVQEVSGVGIEELSNIDGDFISNIYPNPANNHTTIEFFLSQDSDVDIGIYNVMGQLVRQIHTDKYHEGLHKFVFNCSDLSSGLYKCSLNTKNGIYTQSLMIH